MEETSTKVTQMEFAVNMTCDSCDLSIRESLKKMEGIQSVDVDVSKQSVVVKTSQSARKIQNAIESTGLLAVLRGQGQSNRSAAAISILKQDGNILGLVRFLQVDETTCIIDGSFNNLSPGKHGIHVHEFGDLSNGCDSTGNDYNPNHGCHGNRFDPRRHAGDLGNIIVDDDGTSVLRYEDDKIKVSDIIGRAMVIHEKEDVFLGSNHGNAGKGIACGIIARSAGMFENSKKVCTCTGKTIWEERIEARKIFVEPP